MKIPASVLAVVLSFAVVGHGTVSAFSPATTTTRVKIQGQQNKRSGSGSQVLMASNPPIDAEDKFVLEDDAKAADPPKARKRDIIRGWILQSQGQRSPANEDSLLGEVKSQEVEVESSFLKSSEESVKVNSNSDSKVSTIIEQAFVEADKDKSGGLDHWELYDAFIKLDYDVTPETCQDLLHSFDADSNSYLDASEFASLVKDKVGKDVSTVYAMFANERDGMLTSGALRRALELMGVDLNAKKTKSLLIEYDRDGDGKLGLLGFADLVAASPTAKFWLAVDESGAIRNVRAKALNILTRAPKKPVSVHSVLSGWSFVLFFSAYIRLFNPHVVEFNGAKIPVLFDFLGQTSGSVIHQFQVSSIALSITSIMGMYRLPPNSPSSRRMFFWTCTSSVICAAITLSSNLVSGEFGLFNGFDLPWNYLVNIGVLHCELSFLVALDDTISGPDAGRESLPTESRFGMAAFYYIFYMATGAFFQVSLQPFYSSEDIWTSSALSFVVENNLILFSCLGNVAIVLLSSIGALIATLKFEKRIDNTVTPLVVFAILAIFQFDVIVQAYFLVVNQLPFGGLAMEYSNDLTEHFHIFKVLNFICLLTVVNSFAKLRSQNGEE